MAGITVFLLVLFVVCAIGIAVYLYRNWGRNHFSIRTTSQTRPPVPPLHHEVPAGLVDLMKYPVVWPFAPPVRPQNFEPLPPPQRMLASAVQSMFEPEVDETFDRDADKNTGFHHGVIRGWRGGRRLHGFSDSSDSSDSSDVGADADPDQWDNDVDSDPDVVYGGTENDFGSADLLPARGLTR
jgi:hypothetical protein